METLFDMLLSLYTITNRFVCYIKNNVIFFRV